MSEQETKQQDYNQPVAYDASGNPLYAHPPQPQPKQDNAPQVVHIERPVEPQKPEISPELKKKHEESVKQYPQLNLSDGEYVISAVRRHPIGIVLPVVFAALLIGTAFFGLFNYSFLAQSVRMPSYGGAFFFMFAFTALCVLVAYTAIWIYRNNKFFLTNESVIQELQFTPFSKHEQTVSLADIEDASFRQDGILAHLVGYGAIRLSTEGDETTYRFSYVANPKQEIAVLNNAVEAFKNGRSFTGD